MNERIDELAFAAGCHRHKYWDPKHPDLEGFIINQAALDKFAELLLEECMTTVLKESKWYWDKDEFESSNAIQNAARRLKEHFGVE